MKNEYVCLFLGKPNDYNSHDYLHPGEKVTIFNDFGMSDVTIKYNGNGNLWLVAEKRDHSVIEVSTDGKARRVIISDGAYSGVRINGNPVNGEPKRIKLREDDEIRILPEKSVFVHELY
ncbi:MAG: hypothetical protein JW754_00565 [Candidatus Aenigmarchaeota archaeon]|nr:hypothetical protein [Candidatus Aenigmarchaeota archaeon]